MKYCQNCGNQIRAEAKYCEFCGNPQNFANSAMVENENSRKAPVRKMHCPKCRSYHIGPILESQSTEGFSVHNIFDSALFSGLTMLGGFSSKTKNNYEWLCGDCGKHFPNVETLMDRANAAAQVPKIAFLFFLVSALIAFGSLITASWIYMIIASISAVLYIILWRCAIKSHQQKLQTALYWESLCFD